MTATAIDSPALVDLVHLLDATSDDRWAAGHPSTRPRLSPEDRIHDAMRPNDPTADAVTDPARLALAAAWRSAMDHVAYIAAIVAPGLRALVARTAEPETARLLSELEAAHRHWLGDW